MTTFRRARRNVVMMLAGVSILMGIVFLFGTKRPKRRG
jgi:LPXTG-motif cell wall-anchored protein